MKRLGFVFLLLLLAYPVRAEGVTADLSDRFVAITTGFTGAKLLVFGAMRAQNDVAVVIEGPPERVTIWRKEKSYGVWLNGSSAKIESVPGFYAVASSNPLTMIQDDVAADHGLSLNRMPMTFPEDKSIDDAYRAAFVVQQKDKTLFQEKPLSIQIKDNQLFRADFKLPANMPVGTYQAHIFLMKDGVITDNQTIPFMVGQVGMGAYLNDLAHRHSIIYAFMALALAMGLSGISTLLLRRS